MGMICSRFDITVDDKKIFKELLFQILAYDTGRNEKDEFNALRISTNENDQYWNSHFKKELKADNPELVCIICSPYKLSDRKDLITHKMFIEGKNEDGYIIWKKSSYEYLWEIINDIMEKVPYEVKEWDGDGSTSEAWGLLHNHQGTFIYRHSQYYGK
jgi:hypothetical protein